MGALPGRARQQEDIMKATQDRHALAAGIASALALAVLVAASPARAELAGVGGSLGYASPENLDGTAALALHAEVGRRDSRLAMVPSMRYWNVNGYSDVAPNLDVAYQFDSDARWHPYVGGGVGLNFVHNQRIDHTDTSPGLNMLGGVRFPGEGNHYFVEGRFTASDVNAVSLQTGITFHAP
jgi:hypothetical protein